MIQLRKKDRSSIGVEADYSLEKFDKLDEILHLLTPKFEGNWNIVLYDPKLKLIKELVEIINIPEWVDITIYTSQKKIEEIVLQHPALQPKEPTVREKFDILVSKMSTLIAPDAAAILLAVYRQSPVETESILKRLDADNSIDKITKKILSKNIVYTKRTYISDVLLAFIRNEPNRWTLYNKVHAELGTRICYYAMMKYSKKLLLEKNTYLQNEDVTIFAVTKIDAAIISYVYVLFANSTNYNQLPVILYAIENRCKETLQFITGEY